MWNGLNRLVLGQIMGFHKYGNITQVKSGYLDRLNDFQLLLYVCVQSEWRFSSDWPNARYRTPVYRRQLLQSGRAKLTDVC